MMNALSRRQLQMITFIAAMGCSTAHTAISLAATIEGTSARNRLVGGSGSDRLIGKGGADTLIGNSGNDRLWGGKGEDLLHGNKGQDKLIGNSGNDRLVGGDGADLLYGYRGRDRLIGNSGNDRLWGGDDADLLYGNKGRDTLIGNSGNDSLWGGDGADLLYGNEGRDILTGGSGQDRFRGTLTALNGDRITDLEDREQIMVKGANLRDRDIRLTPAGSGMKLIIERGSRAEVMLDNVKNAEATLRKASAGVDIITIDIKESSGNNPPGGTNSGPVSIILDTDFSGDVDDVGTIAMLNELHNRREAQMLAVMSVAWNKHAVAGISAINNFYGNADIPIGRHARGSNNTNATYAGHIANRHKHNQRSQTAESSTTLYRKILANSDDNSVVVVTVGQLRNIEALLKSAGDGISNLNGKSLFKKKVKRLHIMGGEYPKSNANGEANFRGSGNGVARYVVNNANVPIVFNGFEIGSKGAGYSTGDKLDDLPLANPVVRAYHYFFEINPPSYVNGGKPAKSIPEWSIWDQIALIYAVRQKNTHFGKVTRGYNDISANGANIWRNSPDSNQSYLTVKMDPKTFADKIVEPLMIK